MTHILISEDCENSPKKQRIRDFNIAYANGEVTDVLDYLADDIDWEMVGGDTLHGKNEVAAMLAKACTPAKKLVVDTIISHGNKCAANGTVVYPNGFSGAFCDMYTLASHADDAPIKKIVGYSIADTK